MTPDQLIRNWFEELWNKGNVSILDEYLAEPCEMVGLGATTITNRAEFRAFHVAMNNAFSDLHVDVNDIVETASKIAGDITVKGTHISGTEVEFKSLFIATIKNNQIVSSSNLVDFLTVMTKLGSLPPDALETALAG